MLVAQELLDRAMLGVLGGIAGEIIGVPEVVVAVLLVVEIGLATLVAMEEVVQPHLLLGDQ